MGAWCQTTGEYISEPWVDSVFRESRTDPESKFPSVPFLECYGILSAVITLAGRNKLVQVFCDSETAAFICNKRWCKTSDVLNSYIADFDIKCTDRALFVQVQSIPREKNTEAHTLAYGRQPKVQLGGQREAAILKKIF